MKSIYIREDLHRQAKLRAAELGLPLKDLIEQWVEHGLRVPQPLTLPPDQPATLRESTTIYEAPTVPAIADSERVRKEQFIDEMERRGILIRGDRLREQFEAECLALRRILGITTPPPAEPPSIEEVRAIFQHQRELHPEAPSLTEILRQMREEE